MEYNDQDEMKTITYTASQPHKPIQTLVQKLVNRNDSYSTIEHKCYFNVLLLIEDSQLRFHFAKFRNIFPSLLFNTVLFLMLFRKIILGKAFFLRKKGSKDIQMNIV